MNNKYILKMIESVITDKEIDDDAKICLISMYMKISRKSRKQKQKK